MENSVACSTFTGLCNHHLYLLHPKGDPVPISRHTSVSFLPQPLAAASLRSVFMDLPVLVLEVLKYRPPPPRRGPFSTQVDL